MKSKIQRSYHVLYSNICTTFHTPSITNIKLDINAAAKRLHQLNIMVNNIYMSTHNSHYKFVKILG